jgi:hypothetical protein
MQSLLDFRGVGLPAPLVLLLLVVAFAVVSRLVGKRVDGARSLGFALLVVGGGIIGGLPLTIMALGWCVSRAMDFKPNDATPTTLEQFLSAGFRLLPVAVAAGLVAVVFYELAVIPAVLVFAAAHLILAAYYGHENAKAMEHGRPIDEGANQVVEAGQGAAYGLVMWGALVALGSSPP